MIADLLRQVERWAEERSDVSAVVLVGSYARGAAGPESDVDLVIVARDPGRYLDDTAWLARFGVPDTVCTEDYGLVTSLRVQYTDGPEVEWGLTSREWAAAPRDAFTQAVLDAGHRVLYDPDGMLAG